VAVFNASAPATGVVPVRFGRFVLLPHRTLHCDGAAVPLGGRALDLLSAIVQAQGEVVSSQSLIQAAWPGRVVVENALHQHIRALRRALGEDAGLIQTVSGRGYRLMASVEPYEERPLDGGRLARPPLPTMPILGRERELDSLQARLTEGRCVTVVGAAGMGKTRLAIEFALRWAAAGWEVGWVDLAAVEEDERLPGAVARGLGVPERLADPTGGQLAVTLGDRRLLLVLNNCEQVARACARLVVHLLEHCGGLRVLVSSQRPLGLGHETRLKLAPLALPPHVDACAEDIAASPAVQLLLQRADALGAPVLEPAHLAVAAALALRLEGNPLAIELAAARVAALGWGQTLRSLGDHFQLLSAVGHADLPRHRSLEAAIAWGCGLLTEGQRRFWQSLAVFRGGWTLDSAQAVVADRQTDAVSTAVTMAELVDQSMIERDPDAATSRFRMHEAYRCHARAMSGAVVDWHTLSHRHAVYMASWLEGLAEDWDTTPDAEWQARTGADLDNLNTALGWSLDSGEGELAARLVSASFALWRTREMLPSVLAVTAHPQLAHRLQHAATGPVDARLQLVRAMALLGESSDAAALAGAAHAARESSDRWLDTNARVQARLCLASVYARSGQGDAQSAVVCEAAALLGRRRTGRTYAWLCIATAWERQLKGDLPAALDAVLEARVAWGAVGAWLDEGRAMVHAADLRLALGDTAMAISTGHEAVAWFEGRLHRAERGRAMVNLGAAYASRGEYGRAREFLAAGVGALRGQDFTYWVFDHLAFLAATSGEVRWAARWVGYADAGYARHRVGTRLVNEARAREAAMAVLSRSLGAEDLSSLMATGAAADEQHMLTSVAVLNLRKSAEVLD